jgi:putative transposase
MKDRFTLAELAAAMGCAKSTMLRTAEKGGWDFETVATRGGSQRLYPVDSLPKEIQARLKMQRHESPAAKATPCHDRSSLWAVWESKTRQQREAANQKVAALDAVVELIGTGMPRQVAYSEISTARGIDRATLYRWHEKVKGADRSDWPAMLVARHVGNKPNAEFCRGAWEFFKADYLRMEAPTLVDCYRRMERAAAEHGWVIPNQATVARKIKREIPRTQLVLLREGAQALYQLYPPLQRSVADLHALQAINGDGYQHNVFVLWPDGSIARPKTWFWQDVYSRKILSYRVDQTENTDSIRQSFGRLIEQYGIPHDITIDNTRAAANKWMTGGIANRYRFTVKEDDPVGIFIQLGCKVHWTSVFEGSGSGRSKPIERQFGVGGMGEAVDKHPAFAGAYTGKNPTAKPENYGSCAVPLETFERILAQEIAALNARAGRRTEICAGVKSFDQAFAESYANSSIRKATAAQRRLWLLPAEAIRVDKHGTVTLQAGSGIGKNRYGCDALLAHAGQKVVVRFDPQNLHDNVHVETLDGRYIAEAECLVAAGFYDTEVGRDYNRAHKQKIKSTKSAAAAQKTMDALEAARLMPNQEEAPIPTPGAVAMVPRRRVANGSSLPDAGMVDSVLVGMTQQMRREIQQRRAP